MKRILKRALLIVFFYTSHLGITQCQDLFFSEYIEGSSSNRALELFNPTDATINLSNYVVYRNNNGSLLPTDSLFLQGSLAPYGVFVIANPSAMLGIVTQADTFHTMSFYNGDDAVWLKKISTGDTIDIIGQIGVDPGSGWIVATGATNNNTLIRRYTVNKGQTNWTIGATEWDVFPIDMDDSLGNHNFIRCVEITMNLDSNASCNGLSNGGANVVSVGGIPPYTYLWSNGDTQSFADSLPAGTHTVTVTDWLGQSKTDSINITEPPIPVGSVSAISCDTYNWSLNGMTYTSTGNYSDTISYVDACDSIITLQLTINNSTTGTDAITACDTHTWIDGNTYTSSNTTATYTLTNSVGCDSVVTLNLTVINPEIGTTQNDATITSNNTGPGIYQWLDCDNGFAPLPGATDSSFVATANGSYALLIIQDGCTDTSQCTVITGVGLESVKGHNSLINIYPNPTNNQLKVDLGRWQKYTILKIYSMSGQLLQEYQYDDQKVINIELIIPQGQYILEVDVDGQVYSKHKLVKF